MLELASMAGGLAGGGGGGGGGGKSTSQRQDQQGTQTSGNDGSFNVGGGFPAWAIVAVLAVVGLVVGVVAYKKL